MTICYFGDFDPSYPRQRTLIKGLDRIGVEVIICNHRGKGAKKYFLLIRDFLKIREKINLVLVGYSETRAWVPILKLLTKKHIVWDAFYSIYDSWVYDRKLVSPRSLKAAYYWLADWLNSKLADKILLDTKENIKYFAETFKISQRRFIKVIVGTDNDLFYPKEKESFLDKFIVHFHGNFIPLQGCEYIIQAASILREENILFRLIGRGQDYLWVKSKAIELGLKNIEWVDKVPYEDLPGYIQNSDVCLGGFGNTRKANIVSMNKLFEYMACRKPIITGEARGVREFLNDDSVLFCARADGRDLADKIIKLKNDSKLRETLADNAHAIFNRIGTPITIAKQLMEDISYGTDKK